MIASKSEPVDLTAVPPVAREVDVCAPPVLGALPTELDGTFLTIGPNPLRRPRDEHLFAGDGMVHGLRLRDGRAEWYRNRWLRTDRAARILGELPAPGPRHGPNDNANANIVRHAGRTLALGDGGPRPLQLDACLDTVARVDFDGTLPGGFAAHPQHDPLTGELHAVAMSHEPPYAAYLVVDVHGRVRRSVPVPLKRPVMMHAFSLTERHALVYDLPVVFSPAAAAAGSRVPYAWNDGHGARLGLLPRDGGPDDILWVELPPCFVFHPVNAYETGRHIVVDVIRHPRVFDRDPHRPGETPPALVRWTVDAVGGTVVEEQLSDAVQESPVIDDRVRGMRHRFAFTTALDPSGGELLGGPALLRHDLAAGRTDTHALPPGRTAGEAVFVPREPCAPEGDGWLLSMVADGRTGRGELMVLDTADFTGRPAAVVPLPVPVPHGFHAAWVDGG
ncbi:MULTISPECIES: carotenoid oxygenase family protein [unclassified Streptomyces]|uniref:carotenoid oxygenase family protein n=1 Tax=unclassified Streptomyces TaxID=2593676 RepID=UPI00093ED9B5|nr:carotenoid oxygenase family protein [Streptomyces sp. TSRI0107]OKJ81199.1 dioxygenase [Streptomyces sp. TSRI0107]